MKDLSLFLRYNCVNVGELEKLGHAIQNMDNLERLRIDLQGNRF